MVRRVAVPYVDGLDFHAEFRRQESRYSEVSIEKPRPSKKDRKAELRERKQVSAKPATLPIPPAQRVVIGRPAKRVEL